MTCRGVMMTPALPAVCQLRVEMMLVLQYSPDCAHLVRVEGEG